MKTKASYKICILILLSIASGLAGISLLSACDASNGGGCDGSGDLPPEVEDTRTMVPHSSWDCSMPDGIPTPENGELLFEADMTLGTIHDMGQTQYGRRLLLEVTGGKVRGPKIKADFLNGGLDYQLTLSNGAMEIDQVNVLRTSDGKYIYFRNCGAAADATDVRVVPDFEAPNKSSYSFLNEGKFAGTRELDLVRKTMKMKIYDVSNVHINPDAPGAIEVDEPDDVPDQSWECRQTSASEQKGAELFSETVGLDAENYLSVGRSKNGLRNIALITGGTVSPFLKA